MVAISLYRGNLHRVPDVPRRWLMPNHPISLKHFKSLLSRRSKSLSHIPSATTSTNPNPNSNQQEQGSNQNECKDEDVNVQPLLEIAKASDVEAGTSKDEEDVIKEVKDDQVEVERLDGDGRFEKPVDGSDSVPVLELVVANNTSDDPMDGNVNSEAVLKEEMTSDKKDALNEKEKRKREVEDKLQILNARKHNLVQALKQILNVEEELKRRNSTQALATRPSVPLQVDVTNESALMTRHGTPRMGSEASLGGDVEGAETDDVANHNMNSRRLFRMSSTSPTSESPLRRPGSFQHHAVPLPSRATLGASSSSPSRFAPLGHQGHPANLPPSVSVSGPNYIASSPSPAASGGTSVFREARHPSPWN